MEDRLAAGPEGIALRARSQGGEYVLSGVKRFVPFAHVADVILVAARTSESPSDPTHGITIFALDKGAEGISLEPNVMIDQTNKVSTLTLENVRVGREAVVGQVDGGWKILEIVLRRAAVGAAAVMLGAARKCMDMSVEYAKVREQFGQPIGSFQAIKHACAEMLVEVENAHGATYYAAWAVDAAAPDAGAGGLGGEVVRRRGVAQGLRHRRSRSTAASASPGSTTCTSTSSRPSSWSRCTATRSSTASWCCARS